MDSGDPCEDGLRTLRRQVCL
ncbi:hypothetical protein PLANTIT3_50112 [Plantibacter sp. T3]|nr:hypothetical protein PLANTIT3_50112 [Plantibacter sp. T3]